MPTTDFAYRSLFVGWLAWPTVRTGNNRTFSWRAQPVFIPFGTPLPSLANGTVVWDGQTYRVPADILVPAESGKKYGSVLATPPADV